MSKKKRQYTQYDLDYQKSPEQVKNRVDRNRAREAYKRLGKVRVGDGKEIDHIKPLSKGGGNGSGNTRILSRSKNRARKPKR